MAADSLPYMLRELAYFRARLPLTPEIRTVWDTLVAKVEALSKFESDDGIERGWIVGRVVAICIENGAGDRFTQRAMRLVDKVVAEERWSELDSYAFRIVFGEMLLRSYALETPPPHDKIRNVQYGLQICRERLAERGIEMPRNRTDMDADEAEAILRHYCGSGSEKN